VTFLKLNYAIDIEKIDEFSEDFEFETLAKIEAMLVAPV